MPANELYRRGPVVQEDPFDEGELLGRMASGDERAFESIYRHYQEAIFHYILSVIKSPQLSEDLVQEVFLKIWEGRDGLPKVRNFGAFLFTVARNHTFNILKSATRSQTLLAEIVRHAPEPREGDEILNRDYERFIQMVLNSLPARTREIYRRCKEQGRTYEEVARELGISGNAVKRHMVNSINALRQAATRDLGIAPELAAFLFILPLLTL